MRMHESSDREWARRIDALERELIERFGLRSATARARELLADATLAAVRADLQGARVTDQDGSLLEQLEQARARERAAEAAARLVESWHTRAQPLEQLEVEVFVGARSLGLALDPAWLPGCSVGTNAARPASADDPVFLRRPRLRVCEHFEPAVELLIHDPRLATLAMVQIVDAHEGEHIRAQVRQFVDHATYLRHLLLTARDEDPSCDRAVVSVELVLVHEAESGEALHEIGETLRGLASGTDFLHAIGVNVLGLDGGAGSGGGIPDAALRRAFAWLLHDTRAWFAELERRRPPSQPLGRLHAIRLDDYRLPDQRTLSLHGDARLHLLHGHNGAGKSSLVEALELMITGSIERLAGIEDYEHVVRNRWSTTPARITLETDARTLSFELHGIARPDQPLSPGSRAASFRLDQTVMDRLARASDVDRAAELLAAFFSDEAKLRERWRHALDDAEAALDRLPARVRRWLESHRRERQDLHEVAVERLAELAEGQVTAALVDAVLPLPRAVLRPLLGSLDALGVLEATLERDGFVAVDAPLWQMLDHAFTQLAGELPERVRTLELASRTLERLDRWWQEGQGESFDSEAAYADALDEWLELSALVELADASQRVIDSLRGAVARGWQAQRLDEAGSAGPLLRALAHADAAAVDDLAHARVAWARRREQLGRALRQSSESRGAAPMPAMHVQLDDDEVEALDRFGHWWAPHEHGRLGQRIRAAIESGETHSFGAANIGAQAWVTPLQWGAAQMLAPLRELRHSWVAAPEPAVEAPAQAAEELAQEAVESWLPNKFDEEIDDALAELADEPPPEPKQDKRTRGPRREPPRPVAPQSLELRGTPTPAAAPAPAKPPPPGGVPLSAAASPVETSTPTSDKPIEHLDLAAVLERMRHAHAVARRAHEVGVEVQDSFVMRLAADDARARGLIDALNELMALFSPARWAYEDVSLRYHESGQISRLHFETGELRGGERARADLRLNTAQLNAFTLALFLLCAPRVDNPLALLVLDDPLQNMDELTVTTVARGLAKLLCVLPPRWCLMMLFHGEGDLARFHDEVECGVYFLPWLSPTVRGRSIEINCQLHDSRLSLRRQSIEDLVRPWPR